MQSYEVTNNKKFMAALLKGDVFDTFEVKEIMCHTKFKFVLDGMRNVEFYENIPDTDTSELSKYLTWKEVQHHIYELIQGKVLPTYLKIVFLTNEEKTRQISEEVSSFHLTITFKDNKTTCTTGTAYKGFSMDKTPEQTWDNKMQHFLISQEFI